MIRRFVSVLFAGLLLVSSALADPVLVDGYSDHPAEAAMSEYLASRLSECLGVEVTVQHEADEAAAANAFLALPADGAVLLAGPNAMIYSLQGRTDLDLRTALDPVAETALARCVLCGSPDLAALVPDATPESLAAWTEAHPYEQALFRTMDADYNDYLALAVTGDFYLDDGLCADYAEIEQMILDGTSGVIVLSSAMIPEGLDSFVPLCDAEIPGLWQGLFVRSGDGKTLADRLSSAVPDILSSPEWLAFLAENGYETPACRSSDEFRKKVEDETQELISYLTAEGLFFYEW